MVVLLNWAAPSLWPSPVQKVQANMMAALVDVAGSPGIGSLIMPSYTHKRGNVIQLEGAAAKLLSRGGLNLGNVFILPFAGRTDQRQQRNCTS